MNLEQQVVELETRLAFQDDMLQTLSDTVARQQAEIENLQRLVQALTRQASANQNLLRELHQEPPPPHY